MPLLGICLKLFGRFSALICWPPLPSQEGNDDKAPLARPVTSCDQICYCSPFLFGTPKRESWNKSNSANCTLDISQIVSSCTFLLQHLHFHLFSVRTKPHRRQQRRRKEARDSPPFPLWRKKNGKSAAIQGKSRSVAHFALRPLRFFQQKKKRSWKKKKKKEEKPREKRKQPPFFGGRPF